MAIKDKTETAKHSVKTNFIFNLFQQVVTLLLPLVLTPYLSRVLGVSGIGTYSFCMSLLFYFVLFANFGFGYYSQREIAKAQGDRHKQSLLFWEIIIDRFAITCLAMIVYLALLFAGFLGSEKLLMEIFLIYLASCCLDVSFFLSGNEDFVSISLFVIGIRVVGLILTFCFVKSSADLWKYVLLVSLSQYLGNFALWLKLPRSLEKIKLSDLKCLRHFIPSAKLFIPTAFLSLLTTVDKTVIGWLVPGTVTVLSSQGESVVTVASIENGYFEQMDKLLQICLAFVTSFGVVMISRNSREIAKKDNFSVVNNAVFTSRLIWMVGLPIAFGICGISRLFVPIFFGSEYGKVVFLLYISAFSILFAGFSNLFGLQLLIPEGRETSFLAAVIAGTLINVLLLFLLVPFIYSYGAAIAYLVSTITVCFLEFLFVKKQLPVKEMLFDSIKYWVAGIVMGIAVFLICQFFPLSLLSDHLGASIVSLIGIVLFGALLYFSILYFLKDDLFVSLLSTAFFSAKKTTRKHDSCIHRLLLFFKKSAPIAFSIFLYALGVLLIGLSSSAKESSLFLDYFLFLALCLVLFLFLLLIKRKLTSESLSFINASRFLFLQKIFYFCFLASCFSLVVSCFSQILLYLLLSVLFLYGVFAGLILFVGGERR